MSTDNVPDYIEPIIGWKLWSVKVDRLFTRIKVWHPYKKFVGKHVYLNASWFGFNPVREELEVDRDHECPCDIPYPFYGVGRGCGIYAFRDEERLRNELDRSMGYGNWVVGRVALWGRIVEHQEGYRAQYAYPHELVYCDHPIGLETIGKIYGVPVKEDRSWTLGSQFDDLFQSRLRIQFPINSNLYLQPRPRLQFQKGSWISQPWTSQYLHHPNSHSLIKKPKFKIYEQTSFHIHKPVGWWKDDKSGLYIRDEKEDR